MHSNLARAGHLIESLSVDSLIHTTLLPLFHHKKKNNNNNNKTAYCCSQALISFFISKNTELNLNYLRVLFISTRRFIVELHAVK